MAPAVRGYAVRATDDVDPEWSAARCSNENGIRRSYVAPEDQPIQARRTDYRKLPPLVRGFTRVRDEKIVHDGIRTAYGDGTPLPDYRRMCRCDVCGAVLPTLGIAYHQQNGPGCLARAAERKPKPTT
jgi:hypothetical protein